MFRRLFSVATGSGLKQTIQRDLLAALKSKDTAKSTVLRQIQAELVKFEKSKPADSTINEADLISVVRGCSDKWAKAIAEYIGMLKAGSSRVDDIKKMIEKEEMELGIIRSYLPEPYEKDEIDACIQSVITSLDNKPALGVVIKAVAEKLDLSRISRKEIADAVQSHLSHLNKQ